MHPLKSEAVGQRDIIPVTVNAEGEIAPVGSADSVQVGLLFALYDGGKQLLLSPVIHEEFPRDPGASNPAGHVAYMQKLAELESTYLFDEGAIVLHFAADDPLSADTFVYTYEHFIDCDGEILGLICENPRAVQVAAEYLTSALWPSWRAAHAEIEAREAQRAATQRAAEAPDAPQAEREPAASSTSEVVDVAEAPRVGPIKLDAE